MHQPHKLSFAVRRRRVAAAIGPRLQAQLLRGAVNSHARVLAVAPVEAELTLRRIRVGQGRRRLPAAAQTAGSERLRNTPTHRYCAEPAAPRTALSVTPADLLVGKARWRLRCVDRGVGGDVVAGRRRLLGAAQTAGSERLRNTPTHRYCAEPAAPRAALSVTP